MHPTTKTGEFTALIESNVTLINGTQTRVLTFLPKYLHFEEMVIGVDEGLSRPTYKGTAASVQHNTYTLEAGQQARLFCRYNPCPVKRKRA